MADNTYIAVNSIWRNHKTRCFYQVMVPYALDCTNSRTGAVLGAGMVVYREAGSLAPSNTDPVFVREREEFLSRFEHCPSPLDSEPTQSAVEIIT